MNRFFQKKRIFIYYALFFLFGCIFSGSFVYLFHVKENQKRELAEKLSIDNSLKNKKEVKEKEQKEKDYKNSFFNQLDLEAKSFLIFDLEKDIEIFSHNKNVKTGIASLTKIATADIFLEEINKKEQKEKVKISYTHLTQEGNNGIFTGEIFDSFDALQFMMIVSSNDIAFALSEMFGQKEFLQKMNMLANRLGLHSTFFFSESGLDINQNIAGSYSTVGDMVKIVKHFYKKYPKISQNLSLDKKRICSNLLCHDLENTNVLFSQIEDFPYKILFSKTGYTKQTGGSLVMVVKILDKEIILIVLGSSKEGRFMDIKKMANATKKFLEEQSKK